MDCLANKGIVHKRLGTRNVLLTSHLVRKKQDLDQESEVNKRTGKNRKPTKWLAPECFEAMQNCTSMSDVWAFGVVIWETFSTGWYEDKTLILYWQTLTQLSKGQNPYPGIDAKIVPMKVKDGYRMSVPEFCSEPHGSLMGRCLAIKSEDRPTFTHI